MCSKIIKPFSSHWKKTYKKDAKVNRAVGLVTESVAKKNEIDVIDRKETEHGNISG